MALSVLDLFSVGIGPSSSHTVGPMRAAKRFADGLKSDGQLSSTARVQAELFGSLGATGRGHGSDKAVVLGLQGQDPETVDTATADDQVAAVARRPSFTRDNAYSRDETRTIAVEPHLPAG